jgi:phosphonatase-like hydrolase
MIEFYRNDETLAPFPHAETVFQALKRRGIKVALNTGFTRSITDTILHRLRWDDRCLLIDQVICSDEVPHGRPYADMIKVLMDELGIGSPAQVLKIGDTEVDVEEGRNAACGKVVSVTTGAYTREQLRSYGPDHIIDDLEELLPIIEKA